MTEYIDRKAVIDLITCRYENPEICTQEINSIPTADVALVRHGRWELDRYGGVICSECKACCSIGGKTAIHNAKSSQHFCFNCGAKMDLEG